MIEVKLVPDICQPFSVRRPSKKEKLAIFGIWTRDQNLACNRYVTPPTPHHLPFVFCAIASFFCVCKTELNRWSDSGRYKDSANEVLPELPPFYRFCFSTSILCCPLLCGNVLKDLDGGRDILSLGIVPCMVLFIAPLASPPLETQSQDRDVWHVFSCEVTLYIDYHRPGFKNQLMFQDVTS